MKQPAQDVAGFVLAGGRSSRMGEDKALVELGGRPLVAHALAVLRGAGLEPKIAGCRGPLSGFAPAIADEVEDRGPLGGICSALEHTAAEWAVFLSVDLPLLPASLVAFLVADAQLTGCTVTLASVNGYAQTFPAVIRAEALAALRQELDSGAGGCFAAFQAAARRRGESLRVLPAEVLAQSGHVTDSRALPPWQWFLNVNTRQDVGQASAALLGRIA